MAAESSRDREGREPAPPRSRSRKPLIAPGSFLAGDTAPPAPDLLGRILKNDAVKHGRRQPDPEPPAPESSESDERPSVPENAEDSYDPSDIESYNDSYEDSYDASKATIEQAESEGPVSPSAPAKVPAMDEDSYDDSKIASNNPSNVGSSIDSNIAAKQDRPAPLRAAGGTASLTTRAARSARPDTENPGGQKNGERQNAVDDEVRAMRDTHLGQLNIRIPDAFNDWLEEEAHRRRREKVTKQSLVTDALEVAIRQRLREIMEEQG